MKKTFIIAIAMFTLSCYAQTPILPLETCKGSQNTPNAYYKDINLILNQFIGTWKYASGQDTLIIKFKKIEMFYYQSTEVNYYKDFLVGEYRYVKNGVELINSLSNFDNELDPFDYSIWGSSIFSNNRNPICDNCSPNQKRMKLAFTDNERPLTFGDMMLRRIFQVGAEKLEVGISCGVIVYNVDNPPPYFDCNVPSTDFILTKVQ
jgi:hypothetical protein